VPKIEQIDLVEKFYNKVFYQHAFDQADLIRLLKYELSNICNPIVLDFGCGGGNQVQLMRDLNGSWFGLDLLTSPEVDSRNSFQNNVVAYDGMKIPFKSDSFDIIFSRQVFEHVEDLHSVFGELSRILKPGGKLIGSTSHLEPYHSNSYWSITPFGFERLLSTSGFQLEKISAGIDSYSLISTRIISNLFPQSLVKPLNKILWNKKGSPLNKLISLYGKLKKMDKKLVECIKLQFCGHYVFLVKKV